MRQTTDLKTHLMNLNCMNYFKTFEYCRYERLRNTSPNQVLYCNVRIVDASCSMTSLCFLIPHSTLLTFQVCTHDLLMTRSVTT